MTTHGTFQDVSFLPDSDACFVSRCVLRAGETGPWLARCRAGRVAGLRWREGFHRFPVSLHTQRGRVCGTESQFKGTFVCTSLRQTNNKGLTYVKAVSAVSSTGLQGLLGDSGHVPSSVRPAPALVLGTKTCRVSGSPAALFKLEAAGGVSPAAPFLVLTLSRVFL